jgi:hypothetical protein
VTVFAVCIAFGRARLANKYGFSPVNDHDSLLQNEWTSFEERFVKFIGTEPLFESLA